MRAVRDQTRLARLDVPFGTILIPWKISGASVAFNYKAGLNDERISGDRGRHRRRRLVKAMKF